MCIQLLHSYLKHTKGQVRASTEKKKESSFGIILPWVAQNMEISAA